MVTDKLADGLSEGETFLTGTGCVWVSGGLVLGNSREPGQPRGQSVARRKSLLISPLN